MGAAPSGEVAGRGRGDAGASEVGLVLSIVAAIMFIWLAWFAIGRFTSSRVTSRVGNQPAISVPPMTTGPTIDPTKLTTPTISVPGQQPRGGLPTPMSR